MRVIVQLLLLFAVPLSAHASPDSAIALPEPETLSLLAVGGLALLLAKRKK